MLNLTSKEDPSADRSPLCSELTAIIIHGQGQNLGRRMTGHTQEEERKLGIQRSGSRY